MSSTCNSCHEPISWNPKKREELGTKRPLNQDGLTIHECKGWKKEQQAPTIATFDYTKQPSTTEEFTKPCSNCNSEIKMAKLVDGKWISLELDGSGFHRCNMRPTTLQEKPAAAVTTTSVSIEKTLQKTDQNNKLVIDVSNEAAILQSISVLYGKLSELKTIRAGIVA